MSYKVYIYHIVCAVTGKGYIGSTINIYKRKSGHFEQLRKNIHTNRYLQAAFNKYGEENFKFEVVFDCIDNYRNRIEEWFINKSNFNSEFNLMSVDNRDYSVKSSFKALKKEDIYKVMDLIKSKYSLKEICKIIGVGQTTLIQVIKNNYYADVKIPKEIQDIYKANKREKLKKTNRANALNVFVYKTNGEFVGEYNSVPDVAEKLNFNKSSVMNALKRGIQLKGHLFYREPREFDEYIPSQTATKRVVYVFDKDLNMIAKYSGMRDCARILDINPNRINSSCNRLTLSGNYYFVRDNQLDKFKEKYTSNKVLLDNELGQ